MAEQQIFEASDLWPLQHITDTGLPVLLRPTASATPTRNGDLTIEATSNTVLTFKLRGTDGTTRTGTLTLT